MALFRIRAAEDADIPQLLALQSCSPEAARWSRPQYESAVAAEVSLQCRVAEWRGQVAGMIVFRGPLLGESEVLNLAVSPEHRRLGIGRALLRSVCEPPADLFLEVRRSNQGGIAFYRRCGFQEVGLRKDYYRDPPEDAIVMKRGRAAGAGGP